MVEFDDGVATTEVPDHGIDKTDVRMVDAEPIGGSCRPPARITKQRAMEFFRDMGIEEEVNALATRHHLFGDTVTPIGRNR